MSSGASGMRIRSRSPSFTAAASAAHSTRSSRVAGNSRPFGVAPSQCPERPTRCRATAMERGEPSWQTRSTEPTSIPSSSEAVATTARTSAAASRRSASSRASRARLPWWARTASPGSRSPSAWVSRSAIRRVFTNTRVVRCSAIRAAIRSRMSSMISWVATAPSSLPGTSIRRSRSRRPPTAMTAGPPSLRGLRKRATSAAGRTVAERPMRCSGRPATRSSRSRESARWLPRLSRARAWISSTITVSAPPRSVRPRSAVRSR